MTDVNRVLQFLIRELFYLTTLAVVLAWIVSMAVETYRENQRRIRAEDHPAPGQFAETLAVPQERRVVSGIAVDDRPRGFELAIK